MQDRQEDADQHDPLELQRPHGDGPQVDEDDLDVEGHEQQGVQVEGQPEAAPRVADRVDARLVRQALLRAVAADG